MTDNHRDHVTVREFDTFKEVVVDTISTGLDGVSSRLDTINGRIGKHDNEIYQLLQQCARQGVEIAQLIRDGHEAKQRESLREHRREADDATMVRLHSRSEDAPAVAIAEDDKPLTIREIKKVAWVLGIVLAGLGALAKYAPELLRILAAPKP